MTATNGDFYIDNLTHDFYLREDDAWHLKGNIGPNGSAGFGPPLESPAPEGLYVDIDTGDIYIDGALIGTLPGGAGSGVDGRDGTRGFDGEDGRDGDDGVPGKAGRDGVDGADGRDGVDGAPGVDGTNGADGRDGARGFNGDDGNDGCDAPVIPGKDGRDGIDGAPGTNGADGVNGRDGARGFNGDDGNDGEPAPVIPGKDGRDGAAGRDGRDGEDGADGEPGRSGSNGNNTGFRFFYNGVSTAGEPGGGGFLFNSLTFSAVTTMIMSKFDFNGFNVEAAMGALVDSGTPCSVVGYSSDNTKFISFTITQLNHNVGAGNSNLYSVVPISKVNVNDGDVLYLTLSKQGPQGLRGRDGEDGADGEQGPPGIAGTGFDAGFKFAFNSATSGDPGSGKFLANNATWGSATTISISHIDKNGLNVSLAFQTMLTTAGSCMVQGFSHDGAKQFNFVVTGGFVNNGTYDTYNITPGNKSGSNGDIVFFSFSLMGVPSGGALNAFLTKSSATDYATQWSTIAAVRAILSAREVLIANRNYYVRPDGSDGNTGLVNNAGGAFLTIQKAIDVAASLDVSIYMLTLNVADGTYTSQINLRNVVGAIGAGSLLINGNTTTPANVIISVTAADVIVADCLNTVWDVRGMKLQTTTSGNGLVVKNGSVVRFQNMDFGTMPGAFSAQIQVDSGGIVTCTGAYTISGDAGIHWQVINGGSLVANVLSVVAGGATITLSGTRTFTYFTYVGNEAGLNCYGLTFSGTGLGTRYTVFGVSNIFTNNAGANYLPGNVAGTTGTGGQYD